MFCFVLHFFQVFSMSYVEDWWIASNFELEGSMKAVLSALTVTALAFVLIFGLDKVAEAWPWTWSNWSNTRKKLRFSSMVQWCSMGLVTFVMVSWDLGDRKIWIFQMGKPTVHGIFHGIWWDTMGCINMVYYTVCIYILSIYYILYNGMI